VRNREDSERWYTIELLGADRAQLIAPSNPLPVGAGQTATTTVFVVLAPGEFRDGERHIAFRIHNGAGFSGDFAYELVGPEWEREKQEGGQP
jgi:hypothetical protein